MLKEWLRQLNKKLTDRPSDNQVELPQPYISKDTRLADIRFVVLDFETTGLNIRKDKPLSLGAITVEGLKIQLNQQFECIFHQKSNTPSEATLVHGITPAETNAGENGAECLKKFYHFAGNALLVAFHAPFDQQILSRASQQHLSTTPDYLFMDLADIAPAYLTQFAKLKGLDSWCETLNIDTEFDRHHAAADALAAAELLLIALKEAIRQGNSTLQQFQNKIDIYKRLKHQHNFI